MPWRLPVADKGLEPAAIVFAQGIVPPAAWVWVAAFHLINDGAGFGNQGLIGKVERHSANIITRAPPSPVGYAGGSPSLPQTLKSPRHPHVQPFRSFRRTTDLSLASTTFGGKAASSSWISPSVDQCDTP